MSLLDKLTDFVGGGLFKEAKELIKEYWPPDLSPEKRAELELRLQESQHKRDLDAQRMIIESEQAITERISQLEGTVSELKTIPFVGAIVIFTRAMQRQVWGYSTLYINFLWFSGQWKFTEQQESAMWVINLLVLGFLFGERAIQNIAPLIAELMNKRKGGAI
ncbi:MAG: coil containing protein [Podoviridae sp. ctKoA10]|nr:MAG: coil containing protein [Podoviridae sp. ctKoA10]